MTLAALRAAYPDRFHANQDWFADEAFVHTEADRTVALPSGFEQSRTPDGAKYSAATLAALYVRAPEHSIWKNYLWTTDTDRFGQPVYVGDNGRGLEIHRHLALSNRWGHAV